jgi:hypothetical protein
LSQKKPWRVALEQILVRLQLSLGAANQLPRYAQTRRTPRAARRDAPPLAPAMVTPAEDRSTSATLSTRDKVVAARQSD